MKFLLTGCEGAFAKEFAEKALKRGHEIVGLTRVDMDITRKRDVFYDVENEDFDVLIHSAGISKPMKQHETDPAASIEANIVGTSYLAMACAKFNKKLCYISTDYVYSGLSYTRTENDPVKPANNYARSKLGGEMAVQMVPNHLIFRTSMIPKPFPHPRAPNDLWKSCMWRSDAIDKMLNILEANRNGIWNIGGESKTIFAFCEENGLDVGHMSRKEFDSPSPVDCTMNVSKLWRFENDEEIF